MWTTMRGSGHPHHGHLPHLNGHVRAATGVSRAAKLLRPGRRWAGEGLPFPR